LVRLNFLFYIPFLLILGIISSLIIALPLSMSITTRTQIAFAQPSAASGISSSSSKPPNIVFILVDNLPQAALPLYGNLDIKTPNINALAKQGITFTNAYSSNGICSPTRATLMTGLMPSQNGLHGALLDNIPEGYGAIREFKTFPHILKGAGYDTALVGKWHIGTLDTISAAGFDYVVSKASGITNSMYNTSIFDNGKSYKVYEPISDFWTQKASDYIANHSTAAKPFFLTLSLSGPYWGPLPIWAQILRTHFTTITIIYQSSNHFQEQL
jgi:arylsulfatase A-like enzyme